MSDVTPVFDDGSNSVAPEVVSTGDMAFQVADSTPPTAQAVTVEEKLDILAARIEALIESHNTIGAIIDNIGQSITMVVNEVQTKGIAGILGGLMGQRNG